MIYNPAYTYKFQLKTTLITWWAHAKWYVHVLSINLYRNSYRKVQIHIRFMIDWGPPNLCQQMCHTVILWYNIYVSKVMIQLLCIFLASTKKKHCFMTLYWLWTLTISMTSLLTHTVAHSTRPSFRPKTIKNRVLG